MSEKRIVEVTQCAGCAAIHRLATAQERERIIKLLEERILPAGNPDIHSLDSLHNLMLDSLIARIKLETRTNGNK